MGGSPLMALVIILSAGCGTLAATVIILAVELIRRNKPPSLRCQCGGLCHVLHINELAASDVLFCEKCGATESRAALESIL